MANETLHKCVAAMRQAGCEVTFESGGKTVRVVFADGTTQEYSTVMFTLIVTKTLMDMAEKIGEEG